MCFLLDTVFIFDLYYKNSVAKTIHFSFFDNVPNYNNMKDCLVRSSHSFLWVIFFILSGFSRLQYREMEQTTIVTSRYNCADQLQSTCNWLDFFVIWCEINVDFAGCWKYYQSIKWKVSIVQAPSSEVGTWTTGWQKVCSSQLKP